MPSPAYATKEDEYWYNVSPQDELPLAGQVNHEIDLNLIAEFFSKLSLAADPNSAKEIISQQLLAKPLVFNHSRQFLGLSDKRAYLDLSYLSSRTPHPSQAKSLSGCHPWTLARHPMPFFLRLLSGSQGEKVRLATAEMISSYLIDQGLFQAARGFAGMQQDLLELVYTRLIIPKEYQQKAAKRRGHGCEAALANILINCGVTLIPENKAANPMGANDPHINLDTMELSNRQAGVTHAFDMIVLSNGRIKIPIQSLIHTSDPGQYGVDKSNETVEIAKKINAWKAVKSPEESIELWGLVDGVGFSENKPDTINKMLNNFHHFIQLRTLYKAPLRLHLLNEMIVKAIRFSSYYDPEDVEAIANLYVAPNIEILKHEEDIPPDSICMRCGEADVIFKL